MFPLKDLKNIKKKVKQLYNILKQLYYKTYTIMERNMFEKSQK